jgi:hypothetical protein
MFCAHRGSPLPGEGEGEGEGRCNAARRSSSKPLTLVLSPWPRREAKQNTTSETSSARRAHLLSKGKDYLPIILHAEDCPAILLRLGHADSLRYTSLEILSIRPPNGEAKALVDRAHAISVANASALRI